MTREEYLKENNYTVYMHKNKINDKVYIGITKQKINSRWRKGKGYKNCKFRNAIDKYGWDNFEHIILYENLTEKDACKKEIELINKYNSIKNGYNILKGGNLSNKGIHFTEEHKQKIGIANKGERNGMYGKTHTKENKNIIKEKTKKQWLNEEYKQKMKHIVKYEKNRFTKVICLETNEIFFSIKEASRKYNLRSQNISKCCRGLRNKCGNLHWRYYEE